MDEKIFTKLAAIPILAVFLGAAILAIRISMDWSSEMSQMVIGGLLTVCAGSVALVAIVIGLIVGIGFYKSLNRDRQPAQPPLPAIRTLGGYPVNPYREPGFPQITDGRDKLGSWSSNGAAAYDVWEEDPISRQEGGNW